MADIKFGVDQLSSPAPKAWRRFERAYIVALAPALTALAHGWGIHNDLILKRVDILIIFSVALVKAFGMFLGNGQEYVDKSENLKP